MSEVEQRNGDTMESEEKEVKETTKEEVTKEENAEEEKEEKEELKKEENEGEDDEDEDSSDEEELPLGSVEAPVQIMTGKRERKKTERLVIVETPKTPEKKFEVPEGKGAKLGDMAMIAFQLEKFKIQDLKPLHRFLFGKIVKDIYTKKNIRLFSGFPFDKEDPEFAKREALLWRFTMEGLREICTILDLEKKGNKEQIMERVVEFCFNPQPSGRAPPDKEEKKAKAKAKAEAKAAKAERRKQKKLKKMKQKDGSAKKKKKTKTKAKAGGDASLASEDGDTTLDETTTEDSQGDSSMVDSDASPKKVKKTPSKPKSTPKKQSTKKVAAKTDSAKKDSGKPKSPKKKAAAVKTPSKQTKKSSPVKSASKKTPQKKRKQDEIDNDSSDDEPLLKKSKQPPSDSEIKKTVEKILEGANLEEVTMKMVCRKVYDTFPDFPLQHKKDYIKSTVRDIIS